MKRNYKCSNLPILIVGLFSMLVLAGCSLSSATPINYTSPVPPEETCTLYVASTLTVTKFDEQEVKWSPGFGDIWALVQIAKGSHSFVLDYEASAGAHTTATYKATDIFVSYDRFAAGHTYLLAPQPGLSGAGAKGYAIRIGIKDVTNEPDWASWSKAFNWTEGFEWLPLSSGETEN